MEPSIATLFARMKAGNDARRASFGLTERRAALDRLAAMVRQHEEAIVAALQADLGRPEAEAVLMDYLGILQDIRHARRHLRRWMRPRRVWPTLATFGATARTEAAAARHLPDHRPLEPAVSPGAWPARLVPCRRKCGDPETVGTDPGLQRPDRPDDRRDLPARPCHRGRGRQDRGRRASGPALRPYLLHRLARRRPDRDGGGGEGAGLGHAGTGRQVPGHRRPGRRPETGRRLDHLRQIPERRAELHLARPSLRPCLGERGLHRPCCAPASRAPMAPARQARI
jgi:hypothetical protein